MVNLQSNFFLNKYIADSVTITLSNCAMESYCLVALKWVPYAQYYQWPVAKATLIELGLYILWTTCKSMCVLWKAYSTALVTSKQLHTYGIQDLIFLVLNLTLQTSPGVTLQCGYSSRDNYFEDYLITTFLKTNDSLFFANGPITFINVRAVSWEVRYVQTVLKFSTVV